MGAKPWCTIVQRTLSNIGLYWGLYRGCIGFMLGIGVILGDIGVLLGSIAIMEKKMETTGIIGVT